MKNIKPTELYPRLIWYQEKRSPCTPEERTILLNRYIEVVMGRLKKILPTSSEQNLKELAIEKATVLVESEINLPTIMRRILVETMNDHILTKKAIENSESFLQWYQE